MRGSTLFPLALVVASLTLACGTELPTASDPPDARLGIGDARGVAVPLILLPAEGSESQMRGVLLVRVSARVPPNPCVNSGPPTDPSMDVLLFCGVVGNRGLETLASGEFVVAGDTRTDPVTVRFDLTVPPNPCRFILLGGALAVPRAEGNPGPPTISATFLTTDGQALVSGHPGPPNVGSNPGPPIVPEALACSVTVATGR